MEKGPLTLHDLKEEALNLGVLLLWLALAGFLLLGIWGRLQS